MQKDNIYGFQPHPEKSHENGLKILENFVRKIINAQPLKDVIQSLTRQKINLVHMVEQIKLE